MGDEKCILYFEKPDGMRPLEQRRRKLEGNIKTVLNDTV
jgi:hypothetical protein